LGQLSTARWVSDRTDSDANLPSPPLIRARFTAAATAAAADN